LSKETAITLLIGMIGGLASGMLGVGGGVIMVPLMVLWLRLRQHEAHGTSLAVVLFTATASALTYGWQGNIDLPMAVLLAIGSIVGVRLGAIWVNRIPALQLRRLFGLFLFLVGIRLVLPLPVGSALFSGGTVEWAVATIVLGFIAGVLGGIMGVGGGVLMVPAMALLFATPQHLAQGISLLVVIPTGIVGAITHYQKGNVRTKLVPWMAGASILTAVIGASIAGALPSATLRQCFGLFLSLVSLQMIFGKPRHK